MLPAILVEGEADDFAEVVDPQGVGVEETPAGIRDAEGRDAAAEVGEAEGAVERIDHTADGELRAVACSPDGSLAAAAGTSRTVRLWDPLTGQGLLTLDGPSDLINGLAFSQDGSALTCTVHDGSVFLWRTEVAGGLP
ncbi:WD40 repeat domain-containing protein [Tautonia marina]|uniref:WD40 repeat domain-containing protein n=1 Tax=Tautonia marina TaxID=2653855 RepID=UPI001260E92A